MIKIADANGPVEESGKLADRIVRRADGRRERLLMAKNTGFEDGMGAGFTTVRVAVPAVAISDEGT